MIFAEAFSLWLADEGKTVSGQSQTVDKPSHPDPPSNSEALVDLRSSASASETDLLPVTAPESISSVSTEMAQQLLPLYPIRYRPTLLSDIDITVDTGRDDNRALEEILRELRSVQDNAPPTSPLAPAQVSVEAEPSNMITNQRQSRAGRPLTDAAEDEVVQGTPANVPPSLQQCD